MKLDLSVALVATLAGLASGPALAATVFNTGAAFEAATTSVAVETFDTQILDAALGPNVPIVFDNGTSASVVDVLQINQVSSATAPVPSAYQGSVRLTRPRTDGGPQSPNQTVTFGFGAPVTAFAADFGRVSNVILSGLFDGVEQDLRLADFVGSGGFFGLTSTTAFSSVTFGAASGAFSIFDNSGVSATASVFDVDNLALGDATAPVSPIPLPAAALLLAGALGGLGALRHPRRPDRTHGLT